MDVVEHIVQIPLDIGKQLIGVIVAFRKGFHVARDAEALAAQLAGSERRLIPGLKLRIHRDNGGRPEAGNIKGLCRIHRRDAHVLRRFRELCEDLMTVRRVHEIRMHFVREHHNTVAAADVGDLREFFSRKDLSSRVMRVAEEEKLALRIRGTALKILKINFPLSIAENERIIGRGAAILLRDGSERRINRRLHQNLVTRFAERLHRDREGCASGRHKVHHALLKIPVIANMAPADSGPLK